MRSWDQISESWWPYFLAIVCSILWFCLHIGTEIPPKMAELISNTTTAFAVIVGFMATALALIFAIDDRSVITYLKKSFHYKRFVRFFFEAIVVATVALVFSSMLIVHDFIPGESLTKILVTVWIGIALCSLFTSFRVFRILFTTLDKQVSSEEG